VRSRLYMYKITMYFGELLFWVQRVWWGKLEEDARDCASLLKLYDVDKRYRNKLGVECGPKYMES
jgi:hypothetical protein